ncbi:MAG: hypothetical protein N2035_05530 [Chthoniobacterales bacterium]|nr:hypothetical protein [Chthoniobacterales bacterium]
MIYLSLMCRDVGFRWPSVTEVLGFIEQREPAGLAAIETEKTGKASLLRSGMIRVKPSQRKNESVEAFC